MSITWMDGFDLYNSTYNGAAKGYSSFPGGSSYATGRLGVGQCLSASNAGTKWPVSAGSAITNLSFGFAFQVSSLGNTLVTFWNGGSVIDSLRINSSGQLQAYRGDAATLLGSSASGLVAVDTWNYLEVEFTRDASAGVFKAYLNGVQVLNLTGQNTGASDIDSLQVYWPQTYKMDDLYTTNTATKLGECRIDTLRPSADTATKDWTPSTGTANYAMVDETTFDASDYVTGASVGNKDYYDCANLSFTPASVFAVQVTTLAKKDDANTRTFRGNIKSSSTEGNGATRGLGTSYSIYSDIFETDPNGSIAWTATSVNAAQVGIEVVS